MVDLRIGLFHLFPEEDGRFFCQCGEIKRVDEPVKFRLPEEWQGKSAHPEMCNYEEVLPLGNRTLRPFEAVVYKI